MLTQMDKEIIDLNREKKLIRTDKNYDNRILIKFLIFLIPILFFAFCTKVEGSTIENEDLISSYECSHGRENYDLGIENYEKAMNFIAQVRSSNHAYIRLMWLTMQDYYKEFSPKKHYNAYIAQSCYNNLLKVMERFDCDDGWDGTESYLNKSIYYFQLDDAR